MKYKENNMEHTLIPKGVSDKLKGKIIEKTSFYPSMNDADENHLVITFTDGTSVNLKTDSLFKADKKVIDCVKYITIPYGK